MEFQTYNTEEFFTRVYAVNNMPDLRPEDSTFSSETIRPHTVEVIFTRTDAHWTVDKVSVQGYRVRRNGKSAMATWTAVYLGRDFLPESLRVVPPWLKDWVADQVPAH